MGGRSTQSREGPVSREQAARKIRIAVDALQKERLKGNDIAGLARTLRDAREVFLRQDYEGAASRADTVLLLCEGVDLPMPESSRPGREAWRGPARGSSRTYIRQYASPPVREPRRSRTKTSAKVGILVFILFVVMVAAAASLLRPSPSGTSPPTEPPVEPRYDATLSNLSWQAETGEYEGRPPAKTYWFIVDVNVTNTGNVPLSLDYRDWSLRNMDGIFIAFAEDQFYDTTEVGVEETHPFRLVFDLFSFSQPARVRMDLPDGEQITKHLQGG